MQKDISRVRSQWNELIVPGLKIRSLGIHQDQLKSLLQTFEHKPEILITTETWLSENDPFNRFELDDY